MLNRAALPEDTQPDQRIRYVDIGSVDSTGHITAPEEMTFDAAPSRARRLVQQGDSIVSTVRTYLRAIAHIAQDAEDLVVSTGFATLTPRPGAHPRFLFWAARSDQFVQEVVARSVGVSYPAITATELGTLPMPLPSLDEQGRIAEFLDRETARIDDLLAEQRRQLDLLDEHRFVLVSRTVGARLGGEVSSLAGALDGVATTAGPLTPLRFIATIQGGITLGKKYDGVLEERPYLRVANVLDGDIDLETVATIDVPPDVARRHELRPGDVLMTEGGDNDKLGRGTVWNGEIGGCLHQNHVFAIRPQVSVLRPRYLAALTTSAWGRAYFTATAHQTTNLASTNRSKIGAFPIPLPSIEVQDILLSELGAQLDDVEKVRNELSTQVALLREHRQALITAAVSGVLEVLKGVA